jgi:predicted SAM-dependent methyltransferase
MKLNLGCGKDIRDGWENLDFPDIDLENLLPFETNSIDEILLRHVIEHIKEHKQLLKECFRILKPNEIITIVTPNYRGLGCRLALFFGKDYFLQDYNHVRFFTDKMIKQEIIEAGFMIKKIKGNSKTIPLLPTSLCGETTIEAKKC